MNHVEFENDVPPVLVLAELDRINASREFRRGPQLQRLLAHIVHSKIEGSSSRLREFNLALECFSRSASHFDPHRDSGVRVAVSRLRRKLVTYYATEGASATVRIDVPVGTYVPTFAWGRRKLASTGRPPAQPGLTTDAEALELYNRARFALRQQNTDGYRKAIELLGRACAADPEFAQAWSAMAMARLGLAGFSTLPAMPDIESARTCALRALEIEPDVSEALVSLASIAFRYEFDFASAEPLYLQAIARDPASRYAHHSYAFALTMSARFDEAEAEYRTALALDPLDQALRCQQALIPMYTGRYAAAESVLLAILDVDQKNVLAHALLGATYLYQRKLSRALVEYRWLIDTVPTMSIGMCGRAQALAMIGRRKRALAELDRMIAKCGEQFVSPYQVAMVQARIDAEDDALEWLERAAVQRDANFVCAPVDPTFTELRKNPGWTALMRRHGLATRSAPPPA